MADELLVWRDGRVEAVLAERRGRMSLTYERGARPISLSLPVRSTAHGERPVRSWFRGLLPEGPIRLALAYDTGVAADDDFGLLRVLGKDCAGALSLREPGDAPADDQLGPPLSESEIAALLRSLPTSPMGFDDGFRVSLAGMQHKLLVTRTAGAWHRPGGMPSTHILKPPIVGLGVSTVANEAYCQWLADAADLPAAVTAIAQFDGVPVLVSERYDRAWVDGHLRRVHQEDGCQALSIKPTEKYQTPNSGPSLKALAKAVADHGGEVDELLRLATFTVAVGNADWHGKNVAIVFRDDDSVTFAPLYDAMSTRFYAHTATGQPVGTTLGMFIGGVTGVDDVRFEHLVAEGRSWGLSAARSARIIDDTLERVRSALDTVEAPIPELQALLQTVTNGVRYKM